MAPRSYTVIHGKDLIRYMKRANPDLASKLDPDGINVSYLSMISNDEDIRAFMFLKFINDSTAHDATIDMPIETWNSISQTLYDDGREKANAPSN